MEDTNELYKTDCPFEGWQILQAKTVLDWVWNNTQDAELQKWHMGTIHERLDSHMFNLAYNKMGLKPIGKCSISELEAEIERRKNN